MITTESEGQTPLVMAAEFMTENHAILSAICDAYPGAIHVQDNRGRTPLYFSV
jgi:hypothetical protein